MTEPKKYRKKPVVIEAMRFTGGAESATPIIEWVLAGGGTASWSDDPTGGGPDSMRIDTLEGTMRADIGDYIICGLASEFYPCKPAIFTNSYESVDE